jgi:hypothetical protein
MRRLAVLCVLCVGLANAADEAGGPVSAELGGQTLQVVLPDGWKSSVNNEVLSLLPPQGTPHVQLWQVIGMTKLGEAAAQAQTLVVGQVKDFAVTNTTDLTVAGAPAKQLIGTGTEADDGDPSNAEITFFSVGGVFYVLCAHAEGDGIAERHADLIAVLASLSVRQ